MAEQHDPGGEHPAGAVTSSFDELDEVLVKLRWLGRFVDFPFHKLIILEWLRTKVGS